MNAVLTTFHAFRTLVYTTLAMGLWLNTAFAQNAQTDSRCTDMAPVSGEQIQERLKPRLAKNSCYKQKLENTKTLNDGVIGPVTRQWINKALEEPASAGSNCEAIPSETRDCTEQASTNARAHYYSGVQPYVLLADDLETFTLNASVREILEATAINEQENQFITIDAALTYVEQKLAEIEGISEPLTQSYLEKIEPMITDQRYHYISSGFITTLLSDGKPLSAESLTVYTNQLLPATDFRIILKNALEKALGADKVVAPPQGPECPEAEEGSEHCVATQNTPEQTTASAEANATKERLNEIMQLLDDNTLTTTRYQLTVDETTLALGFPSLDQSITDCITALVGVVYPNAYAFSHAIDTMLMQLRQSGLNTLDDKTDTTEKFDCVLQEDLFTVFIEAKEANENGETPPEKAITDLQCALMEKAENDLALLLSLDKSQCRVCATQHCLTYTDYIQSVVSAVSAAAEKPFLSSSLNEIHLRVLPECQECALPLKGTTYGFYPYWLASSAYEEIGVSPANPGYLNFSLFSRMAYFALPINDNGELNDLLHWKNPRFLKRFVQHLKQFNVKRDIVLYTANWANWPSQDQVKVYAEEHYAQLKTMQNSVEKYGGINGVTLYFDHYGAASDPSFIITYISRLYEKIREESTMASHPWLDINLMLSLEGLDNEESRVGDSVEDNNSYFAKLQTLFMDTHKDRVLKSSVEDIEKGEPQTLSSLISQLKESEHKSKVNHILVFLNESTSINKKKLRLQIENEFKGEARVDSQEKIIPILGRLNLSEENASAHRQFMDDIAYLKYNFGGIGFWNLPLTTENEDHSLKPTNTEMQILSHTLKLAFENGENNYVNTAALGGIGAVLHSPALTHYVSVCAYVCPHRAWTLPIVLVLLAANAIIFVLYRSHCPSRTYIKSHRLYFALLNWSVVLFIFIIFGCDPNLQPYANITMIIFVAAMLGIPLYRSFLRLSDRVE